MNIEDAVKKTLRKHQGKDNAISRTHLRSAVMQLLPRGEKNISDRQVRMAIELLRRTDEVGARICSSSSQRGYWLSEDFEEVLENYREERRRSINNMVTIRNRLRRARVYFSGQRRLL